ncbi:hypothetical protein [uncultured Flavobacterium sp.]|uniref:hypothetical protein n=1 Tax=uncultured Flavobacterium sp. TaxID=165435 RepID=UPI0030EDD4DC
MMTKLENKEILDNVIEALGVKKPEFRKALKYSSNTTIYNVYNGVHGISNDMINRILNAYPEVNHLYLKRGHGTPLKTEVSESFSNINADENISINEFLNLPKKVKLLEQMIYDLSKQVNDLKLK